MPVSQPFIITSPDLGPPGREWWFNDPQAGPIFEPSVVATVFYGWTSRTLQLKLDKIKDEYDIPKTSPRNFPGRQFRLYDVERINRIFLNRGIIDYRRFYGASQILTWMGRNHDLI